MVIYFLQKKFMFIFVVNFEVNRFNIFICLKMELYLVFYVYYQVWYKVFSQFEKEIEEEEKDGLLKYFLYVNCERGIF